MKVIMCMASMKLPENLKSTKEQNFSDNCFFTSETLALNFFFTKKINSKE